MVHECDSCGISKESLKNEILCEILPIIFGCCKGSGERATYNNGLSSPIELGLGGVSTVPSNYAVSAGVLEKEIRDLQLQIDRNYADITHAKEVYDKEVDYLLRSSSFLHQSTEMLENEMNEVQDEQESQEMYGRRNILQVDEYEEQDGEDTNQIVLKLFKAMGLKNVNFRDICRTHRNGRRRKYGGPRPIYVKLVSHDLKDEVLKRKNELRKNAAYKNVFINENLTRRRRWLYKKVREEVGGRSCYTYDGTIYVKNLHGNMLLKINNVKDFFNVFNKYPQKE